MNHMVKNLCTYLKWYVIKRERFPLKYKIAFFPLLFPLIASKLSYKRKNIAFIIQQGKKSRLSLVYICGCITRLLLSRYRAHFVSSAISNPHGSNGSGEREKTRRRGRGSDRGQNTAPSFCRRYTSRTYATAALYGRKGVSCMRAALRAAYTGKRNVAMETTMATLNQYTRRGVGRSVGSFVCSAGRSVTQAKSPRGPIGHVRERSSFFPLPSTSRSPLHPPHLFFSLLLT